MSKTPHLLTGTTLCALTLAMWFSCEKTTKENKKSGVTTTDDGGQQGTDAVDTDGGTDTTDGTDTIADETAPFGNVEACTALINAVAALKDVKPVAGELCAGTHLADTQAAAFDGTKPEPVVELAEVQDHDTKDQMHYALNAAVKVPTALDKVWAVAQLQFTDFDEYKKTNTVDEDLQVTNKSVDADGTVNFEFRQEVEQELVLYDGKVKFIELKAGVAYALVSWIIDNYDEALRDYAAVSIFQKQDDGSTIMTGRYVGDVWRNGQTTDTIADKIKLRWVAALKNQHANYTKAK